MRPDPPTVLLHAMPEVVADDVAGHRLTLSTYRVSAGTSFDGVVSSWERRVRWPAEHAPATLIRLSVGIEGVDDLSADIDGALSAAVA